jgi:hypothetical protein
MANETKSDAPLTATVGEQLTEKEHAGEPSGLDVAERAVVDAEASARGGTAIPQRGDEPVSRGPRRRSRPSQAAAGRAPRPALGWAVAAGVGTLVLAGVVRRAFGR